MNNLKFTKTHEWVRIENKEATIGITNYAQEQLGDIVYVELPQIGDKFKQGSQLVTVESTKAAAEVYAPLSGEVVAVNEELLKNPQWINESPYEKGWMVKLKLEKEEEINNLWQEKEYNDFISAEKKE